MEPVVDIKNYKNKKKLLQIRKDLKVISNIYSLTISALYAFKYYQSVMEVMSVLQTNKSLCDVNIGKIDKRYGKLEETKTDYPDPSSA